MKEGLVKAYDSIFEGDVGRISHMPVESFLPMIFLRYLTGFAKDQTISPEHLEYGFDPEMLFEGVRPFPKKKGELLKEINSEFSVAEEGSDPKFI